MDNELMHTLISGMSVVIYGIIAWQFTRATKRADNHSERIKTLERMQGLIELNFKNSIDNQIERQKSIDKRLDNFDERFDEGAQEHRELDRKITTYLLENPRQNKRRSS